MGAEPPWYEAAFRDDYRRVYAHRDLEAARPEVRWLVEGLGLSGRVLDLACGFGRHTLLMARAGLEVVGLDLSADLLRAAGELKGFAEHLAGRLVRADASRLPFRPASFDAVVVLFSSFGYLGSSGDGRVLDGIAGVLRRGGRLVLDLMNAARVRAALVPESSRAGDGWTLVERRALEDGGRRVVKDVELRIAGREPRVWREDVRMYEADEIQGLLEPRGLRIEALHGDFGGAALTPEAPRMLVVARRH